MPLYAHIKNEHNDGWYRVVRLEDLKNPKIAHETYAYLDDLADMHKTALSQRLLNMPELLMEMTNKLEHPEQVLEKKGILYVNRVGGYYPDPSEDEIIEIREFQQRPVEDNTGLTGWLDSDGHFYESIYGTHNQIAWNHNLTDDDGAIYFAYATSPLTGEMTDLVKKGFYEPTKKQKEWLLTYMSQLSIKQQQMVDKILKGC